MTRRMVTLVVALLACAGVGGVAWARSRAFGGEADPLPYYESHDLTPRWSGSGASAHRIAPFVLTSQSGTRVSDADLAGKVHVASFIYTRCAVVCPALVKSLKRVQSEIGDPRLVIVSYSVTPELDPPAVLASFGRERGIDPSRWYLLTGDREVIYRLARDSYFTSDDRLPRTPGEAGALLHTEQLVLVDRNGQLRGIYNGTQPAELDHLVADAQILLAGPG
jgi:protein SCO1/2